MPYLVNARVDARHRPAAEVRGGPVRDAARRTRRSTSSRRPRCRSPTSCATRSCELETLPLKFVCHSPCFRTRGGLLRQGHARHDPPAPVRQGRARADRRIRSKLVRALEELTGHAEAILKKLELPYRVVHAVHRRHGLRRPRRPTTSKSGCRGRTPIARSRRAATSRRSRRGACRRASATRKASPSSCTR